ncbi:MAG TPA: YfhO family protein [Gemmatimonadota bacterium]|jgi:hypothetical protein
MARSRRTAQRRAKSAPPPVARASRPLSEGAFALGFLALCAALALAFFHAFVFSPGTMPFGTDMLEEAYPLRNFAVEEIRAGRPFPVWNPFAYSGIPFLETLPYPVYYPTSLLYFVMPLGRAIGWAFVLHFMAAGVFMFLFARRLGVSRWGAALAGLAWMFNGYMVSHLYAGQDGRMFAMVLIPLVFTCLRAGLDTRRLGPYLLMGGAVALQIFTPHVQIMYFSSLAAAAYFLTEAFGIWRREGARAALGEGARFAAGFALAGLVGAVELWPTATFLETAVRGAESGYAYASSWAMPPRELSALLVPDLIGSLQTYWGTNPFKLHTEYLGAVPLILALAALLWAERPRKLFWALLALTALLFAMGAATPVHHLAYAVLPMIKSFRAPSMMTAVAAFAVATLAGLGFDALAARGAPRQGSSGHSGAGAAGRHANGRTAVLLAISGLLALAWIVAAVSPATLAGLFTSPAEAAAGAHAAAREAALHALPRSFGITVLVWFLAAAILLWGLRAGRLGAGACAMLLAGLLVLDLWRIDARFLSVVDVEQAFAPSAAENFLAAQEGPFRIFPLPGAMGPNQAILHRLESVSGLQKFRLAWYDLLQGGPAAANLGRIPLWRVLNLRYVVSARPLETPDLERVFEGPPAVYRWRGEAPRAWLARRSRVVGDQEALSLLSDPGFDPRQTVLLAEPLTGPWAEPPAGAGAEAPSPAAVRFVSATANRIEAEVTAAEPSLAVFSEAYHPFWRAEVDGKSAPLARADLAFRAVPVPSGTHRVTMLYEPRAFERGRLVTLAGLAAALAYAAASAVRGKRGPGGAARAGASR